MYETPLNPYAAPLTDPSPALSAEPTDGNPWKKIARRWELLRLPYNLLVGLAGLAALAGNDQLTLIDVIDGVIVFGIGANIFYFFGPIVEMYLHWLGDAGENRFLPRTAVSLIRSPLVTWVLFLPGVLFSVCLTLGIGFFATTAPVF